MPPIAPTDLAATLVARRRQARERYARRAAELCREVRAAVADLRREGALGRAWLVGSLAWGGFGERSDVDVVVSGADGARIGALTARLEARLGARVDLLRHEDLPEPFKRRAEERGIELDEP